MRRALLVTVGTVAGLATVLSYTDGQVSIAGDLASAAGPVEGLGAPPADEAPTPDASPSDSASADASQGAKPKPSSTAKASAKPTKAAATTAATDPTTPAAKPTTAAPKPTAAAPKPTPTPTPTKAAPKPTPKPAPALPNGDFVGSAVTHRYGTVQVAIRVVDGKITKAWAAKYPTGDSAPYSEFAIPKLSAETVGAKSASVAAVAGATLTSKAWVSSLASALSKAGI